MKHAEKDEKRRKRAERMQANKNNKALRLKILRKTGSSAKILSWRDKHNKKKAVLESKAIKKFEAVQQEKEATVPPVIAKLGNQDRRYKLGIAIPGSILNNAQSPELRSYLAGQIARTAAVFCVDEVIVFDETARMSNSQVDSYFTRSWTGQEKVNETNVECNFHLARILEYLECPQYLRKQLFPLHPSLRYSGVLNPLDSMSHLRATDLSIPYREGVVLDKPVKIGRGPFCDVGLEKDLQIDKDVLLPPGTRVTVKVTHTDPDKKNFRGSLVSARSVREKEGLYWGYTVKLAKSFSEVIKSDYDVIVGTSERGQPIADLDVPISERNRVLIVFGGLDGLESAVDADEQVRETDPAKLFTYYINAVPDQGSRTIRTEEAVMITLSALKLKFDKLFR
ncbi:hypothetical protein QR680_012983 [Steinernema hermaphroditum]|uniref:Uncharacterized protein n=1 Tax=Steinernema hermaphroditum TaxID=289476 RepID=A0AA39M1J3_9BILA|nr:hypothetical protein QR680_012983 [Steinernema hermaphroditum]